MTNTAGMSCLGLVDGLIVSGLPRPSRPLGRFLSIPVALHAALGAAAWTLPLLADPALPARAGTPPDIVLPTIVTVGRKGRPDARPPRPSPPPRGGEAAPVRPVPPMPAPVDVPDGLPDDFFDPLARADAYEGVAVGSGLPHGGPWTGAVGRALDVPPPAPPVRVGGEVREPYRLHYVAPVYPELARRAGVEGLVILEATLDPQGAVRNVRVLRGVPLLDQAAIEAVRQWVYSPTTLNGVPVPVLLSVTVRFRLSVAASRPS